MSVGIGAARDAFADVATAPVDILVVGDSVGEGAGATALGTRWIEVLQQELRTAYPVGGVGNGSAYVPAFWSMDVPVDWVPWESPVTTAGVDLIEDYGLGGRAVQLNAAGEKITFTGTGDKVQVFYLESDFFAAELDIVIDGGSPTTVDSYDAGASGGVAAVWTSGTLTNTSHTVEVSWNTSRPGNSAFILGARFYDADYGKSIHVWDGSHGGWTADWHQYVNEHTSIPLIDPDLVVISLGFNDAGGGYTTAAFATKLRALVADVRAQKANVPILLVGLYNPRDASWSAQWPLYINAMRQVASETSYAEFIDLSKVMPDTWALPSLYADLIHPSDAGHREIARHLTSMIRGTFIKAADPPPYRRRKPNPLERDTWLGQRVESR